MTGLFDVLVTDRRELAVGVLGLVLAHPDGAALPSWTPGAHVDLAPEGGPERQYSLCGRPSAPAWEIAVLREPDGRGGSAFVHDRVRVGDRVRVRGPRNHFPLVEAASYRFVAGGIGITPIRPMIAEAAARGADWRLLYGGRTAASMAFAAELAELGERVRLRPQDEHGLLDLKAELAGLDDDTAVYCCGPEPLLAAVAELVPPELLHVERFAPVAVDRPDTAFDVQLNRSGRTVRVAPGRSVLESIEAAGVPVLFSCREGTCGTCETEVLDGEPDHRDSLLTERERAAGDTMLICVSRALGPRLVLDL
ncbi:MAG TPA: PDR/VanB family oxidoreductase [Pseudonocardiaceae bacterium]|nr:PDR/VanB family oxidoreductase [Pseudonocardiaceae bacterium]